MTNFNKNPSVVGFNRNLSVGDSKRETSLWMISIGILHVEDFNQNPCVEDFNRTPSVEDFIH